MDGDLYYNGSKIVLIAASSCFSIALLYHGVIRPILRSEVKGYGAAEWYMYVGCTIGISTFVEFSLEILEIIPHILYYWQISLGLSFLLMGYGEQKKRTDMIEPKKTWILYYLMAMFFFLVGAIALIDILNSVRYY